jgi:hypothetical protein
MILPLIFERMSDAPDRVKFRWLMAALIFISVMAPMLAFASDAPPGCPKTLFCGCALSIKKFGRIVTTPNLKQALTWARVFPRDRPASGNVAVGRRRGGGHVFELLYQIKGDVWMVFDPNSGNHRTRTHPRSIAGKTIVNPHGSRLAMVR